MGRGDVVSYELIHGDCLDVIGSLSGIDAVITDPPYGCRLQKTEGRIGSHTSKAGIKGRIYRPIIGDDQPFDPAPWLGFPVVVLWGANWYGSRLPDASRWLVWDKRKGTNSNNMADCELAWTNLDGPARLFHHRWMGMIRDSEKETRDRTHPNQKPVALMEWVLDVARVPIGATVLDPYMGSGTTGVACLNTGRRFIGIEKDAAYFAIAQERLAAASQQLRIAV